jgi:endoglycosylceramidase
VPYVLDSSNRARFFHGTNFVEKGFPWYPAGLLEESKVQELASLGINTVRLGFMWSGAEPAPGQFNETYFQIIGQIIHNLEKYEIYPFLDVHQDVMSTYFCLYDGFPRWTVEKSTQPEHAMPWPLKPGKLNNPCPLDRNWARNYLSEACSVAFQSLYTDGSPMQQDFTEFWRRTAAYFKDYPILGYEIINEPWAGDIYSDPALLLPGHAGSRNLMPLYDKIVTAIRSEDPQHLVLYEPVTWGMIFNGNYTGSGFDHVPGAATFDDAVSRSVFSFHYYCWWYDSETNDMARKTCDHLFGPKIFSQVVKDVKRTGGAVMLTEWGQGCAFDTDGVDTDPLSECNQIMDLADRHLISWTDWYFGGHLNTNWNLSANANRLFSRSYARSIAGKPLTMHFNVTNKQFDLCFELDTTGTVTSTETEIFARMDMHYPHGVDLTLSPNIALTKLDKQTNKILLRNRGIAEMEQEGVANAASLNVACVKIAAK